MTTGKCFSLVRGRVMRATRLDGCGAPVDTDGCNVITTEGFISVALTANTTTGEAINVTNAAGKTCVSEVATTEFNGYGVEINFCEVDPELYGMLTNQTVVYDIDGLATGFRVNSDRSSSDAGFALELWSGVPGGSACSGGGGAGSFGYLLLPFLQGGVLGDFTLENAAVSFTITGAQTKTGSGWGVGPYNVLPTGALGVAGPLATPILSGDHLHVELTNVAPPEPGCGCPVDAEGATAGSPGVFTPAGADAPENLAALILLDPVASPNTAWTTGQHVVLGDGSRAHWDGDDWVAGNA